MFELPSAMFLIADGKEFRFARFYIVCEEVPLGTPESPPIVSGVYIVCEAVPLGTLGNPLIVCGLSDTSYVLSKRGKRHRI